MEHGVSGEKYSRIGEALLSEVDDPEGKFFIYAEVEPQVVDFSVYEMNEIELIFANEDYDDCSDAVLSAWYSEPDDKRWVAMEYAIDNGRFSVQLHYRGEIDLDDDDRREKLLAERFPGKAVRYPPPEELEDWAEK
jgi:hypothetical protein